mmetsp:Transcript_19324/g.42679  ORF Transcript_19324/g.42679 Transcript_19324/m.42679 type:complete len:251 (-) Transcript_19324:385-1137(-)
MHLGDAGETTIRVHRGLVPSHCFTWSYPAQLLLQQLHKGQQLHQDAANRHEGRPCQPRAAGAKQNVTGRGQMPLLAHVGSPGLLPEICPVRERSKARLQQGLQRFAIHHGPRGRRWSLDQKNSRSPMLLSWGVSSKVGQHLLHCAVRVTVAQVSLVATEQRRGIVAPPNVIVASDTNTVCTKDDQIPKDLEEGPCHTVPQSVADSCSLRKGFIIQAIDDHLSIWTIMPCQSWEQNVKQMPQVGRSQRRQV